MSSRVINAKELKKEFEEIAVCYFKLLCAQWELYCDYGSWYGGEIGSLLDYGDGYITIDYDDMRYCVENEVSIEEYLDWQHYIHFCYEYKQDAPNFKSWHKGCPRISKETRERLYKLKAEFEQACKEASNSIIDYGNGKEKA